MTAAGGPGTIAGMETNWAGNHTFQADAVQHPTSVEQVQEIVARADRVRVVGQRHSFNDIADAPAMIALDLLPPDVVVDREGGTVTFGAGLTYAQLADALRPEGLALHNLASLPHVSVAGAVSTATHGSGGTNGNLATAVAGLELVSSSGEIVRVRRGDPDFDGMVVGLGALGAVTRVTLDAQPAYEMRQVVYEGMPWDGLFDNFDAIAAWGYSVSVFTRWDGAVGQVWVKTLAGVGQADEVAERFGAVAAGGPRHPVPDMDPVNCTPQLGEVGLWSERLTHFRPGFTPSAGDELQAEFFVARDRAVEAMRAVREIGDRVRPLLRVTEIRTIAADRLWMSPQYERDTVAIHFTMVRDVDAVERLLADVERTLAPFGARPHWGKLFLAGADAIGGLYERRADFAGLVERMDPRGAFRNAWLERHVLGA